MSHHETERARAGRTRSTVLAAAAVAGAVLVGVFVHQPLVSSPSSAASQVLTRVEPDLQAGDDRRPPDDLGRPGPEHDGGPLGPDDGLVAAGATVFDHDVPAVARLDSALLDALRQAATEAADAGVVIIVNSGWRSPRYQEHLLAEAVSEYGSRDEAARWVATADTSAHVSGHAIDVGPAEARAWLSDHGADYGLCQIYDNEPWHFELRAEATGRECPSTYADPTHDPRMQP